MSKESLEWLRTWVLLNGNHGGAWWDNGEGNPNIYPGSVPLARVEEFLNANIVREATIAATVTDDMGNQIVIPGSNQKAMVRMPGSLGQENGKIFRVFTDNYQGFDFRSILLDSTRRILGTDELNIGSFGFLRDGAVAWITVEMTQEQHAGSFDFRPFLVASTSVDGTLATQWDTGFSVPVCDNTLSMFNAAAKADGFQYKVKRTVNALDKIENAAAALGILRNAAKDAREILKRLADTPVSDDAWSAFLDGHKLTTLVDPKGNAKEGRGLTTAENRRGEWNTLYTDSPMVAPWNGSALGVLQTVNTWEHHKSSVHGGEDNRWHKNMTRMVSGEWSDIDGYTMATLEKALVSVS